MKKEDPPVADGRMGQADQRVPTNGVPVDVQPDHRVVTVGGQLYVIAFFDTGSSPNFCTQSFVKKFQRHYPGHMHQWIQMGGKKIRIPVYELAHQTLNVRLEWTQWIRSKC